MDSTWDGGRSIWVIFVAHPELTAKGSEGARHYSWIFNLSPGVEEADISDSSGAVHLPHAAAKFTRHEHVVPKCALLVEGNPSMVRRAACVWNDCKQGRGIG
jgi:hypothetical protein